jgi:hypothetical protein
MTNHTEHEPGHVLAALCKFSVISKAAPDYYDTHWQAVDRTFAGLRTIAQRSEPLQIALARSLPLGLEEGAVRIRAALRESKLPDEHLRWMSEELVQLALAVLPMAEDSELPKWLEASGRVIREYLAEAGEA